MDAQQVRVMHKMVSGWHVFTSPDMPNLFVAHLDRDKAFGDVESVVRAMDRAAGRPERPAFKVVELEHA